MNGMNNDPSKLYDEEFMRKREEMFKNVAEVLEISSGREEEDLFEEEEKPEEAPAEDKKAKKGGFFSKLKRSKDKDDDEEESGYDIFDLGEIEERKKPKTEKTQKKKAKKEEKEDYISVSSTEPEEKRERKSFRKPKKEKVKEEIKEEIPEIKEEEIPAAEKEEVSFEGMEDNTGISDEKESSMDDINALLASVGISPVSYEEEDEKEPSSSTVEVSDGDLKNIAVVSFESEEKIRTFEAFEEDKKEKTKEAPVVSEEKIADEKEEEEKEDDGQFILAGYKDEEAPVSENEADIEDRLKTTRKNLIDNFRVLKNDTDDSALLEKDGEAVNSSITDDIRIKEGEGVFEAVDRAGKKVSAALRRFSEKSAIKNYQQKVKKEKTKEQFMSGAALTKKLREERRKKKKQVSVLVILTAVLLSLSALSNAYVSGGSLDFMFGSGARIFVLINILILGICVLVSLDKIREAFDKLIQLKLDSDSVLFITLFICSLQLVVSLILGLKEETGYGLYASFAAFAILVSEYTEYLHKTNLSKSVSLMMRGQLTGIYPVLNKADAAALGHGISETGDPLIYYSADSDYPENILDKSKERTGDEKFFSVMTTAVVVLAVVLSFVFSIINHSVTVFALSFAGFVCLTMPNMRSLVLSMLMEKTNSKLLYYGATVAAVDSCDKIGKANGVVVDAEDIFTSKVSKFKTVPGSRMAQSDAVVYAAATLKNTNCLIRDAFDEFLEECGIKLPEAEEVTYEDRLGYSSWVAGKRVLVGNREMLVQHSIDCPTAEEEYAYSKGRSIMYVVVEGIIAATFMVTFSVKKEVKKSTPGFNKTGLVLMINCVDPWLNEENSAMKLGAEKALLKITSSKGAEIISQYKKNVSSKDGFGLLCTKKQKNVVSLINAAHNLYTAQKLARIINIAMAILSAAMLVLFAALKVSVAFGSTACILIQLICSAAAYYIGSISIK